MNLLKFIGKVAVFVLQMLAYGWLLFLVRCFERLIATVKQFLAFLKLSHSEQEQVADKCCKFTNPAFHRPDPCIYDQYYLMQLGRLSWIVWRNIPSQVIDSTQSAPAISAATRSSKRHFGSFKSRLL